MISSPNVYQTRSKRKASRAAVADPSNMNSFVSELSDMETLELYYDWPTWARQNQMIPLHDDDWTTWLILAGRGWGKTRCGAEFVRYYVENGLATRIALIAEDAGDARDVMIEGESGILAISHPKCKPTFVPSKRRIEWPNGAIATIYSDNDPETLRGPQHDLFWCDELAKFRNAEDMWSNLMFGLRLGQRPRGVITTTPKPIPIVRRLMEDERVYVTSGTTHENFNNLAPTFRDEIIAQYEGTRIGRQELYAEVTGSSCGTQTAHCPSSFTFCKATIVRTPKRLKTIQQLAPCGASLDPMMTARCAPCSLIVGRTSSRTRTSDLKSSKSTAPSTASPARRWTSC